MKWEKGIMENEHDESGWNIGLGLGLGALIGVLVSAIIGMLRLSKPKKGLEEPPPTTISTTERTAASPPITPQLDQPVTVTTTKQPPTIEGTSDVAITTPATTSWSIGTKYFVSALLFLAFLGILYISSSSMSTIIFAALLTFIVYPIIKFFQRRLKMRRGSATVLTYILVLALLILIPILIIPGIVEAVQFVANINFANLLQNLSDWVNLQAQSIATIPLIGGSLSSSLEELARILGDLGSDNPPSSTSIDVSFQNIGGRIAQTLEFLVSVFGPLVSIVTTVVFTLLISLHMSLSIDWINEGIMKLIPANYKEEIAGLISQIINIWKSFLRGQLSLMVIVGVIVWLGNEILGTPQALFLGILAGLLEVIPSLGPILATIPAVILALLFGSSNIAVENWVFALIVIGFYILVQIIENQVLVPYVLGDAVDLPPLIVIIGVVIGGSAFGLLGVFLATPVISTGREVFMYLYDKILEPPPEPEPPEEKPTMLETLRGFVRRLPRPRLRRAEQPDPVTIPEETPAI
jgi:predicted PurR-regulated permease PerM